MARKNSSGGRRTSSSYYDRSSPTYNSSSRISTIPKPSPKPLSPEPTVPSINKEFGNKSSSGGFMSAIKDGFGFGFGSSIAHRVMGSIFGSPSYYPSTTEVETHHHSQETYIKDKVSNSQDITKPEYITNPECKSLQEEYLKCIQSSNTDFDSSCDFSLNIFKDCEENFKTFN